MFDHPDAKTAWKTVRVRRDSLKTILIVETQLCFDKTSPDCDEVASSALIESIKKYLVENPDIDEADLTPIDR